jgi:hypothetical protein
MMRSANGQIHPEMGLDSAALFAALDERRVERRLSWDAVAREIGVATATVLRIRSGSAMDCDGFLAMVRWLGCSVADQMGPGVAPAMLARLKLGGRTSAGLALRAVRWLDMPVNAFVA